MRGILLRGHGDPRQALRLEHVPDPPAPGPDELLVRVLARPVHPGDLHASPGAVPGLEGMGTVERVGRAVEAAGRLFPGMRVAFFPVLGTWAERVLVPAERATVLPADVPDAIGAQLHVNPLLAQMLLRAAYAAGAGPGQPMLLTTAADAVARLLAALALRAGMPVIGLASDGAHSAGLAALHPDMPVLTTDQADWRARLAQRLAGRPLRAVFDAAGDAASAESAAHLAPGGTLVAYGTAARAPAHIPAQAPRVAVVSLERWTALPPDQRREDLRGALDLARHYPHLFAVAARYDLDDADAAIAHARRPGEPGVVLLTSRSSAASWITL